MLLCVNICDKCNEGEGECFFDFPKCVDANNLGAATAMVRSKGLRRISVAASREAFIMFGDFFSNFFFARQVGPTAGRTSVPVKAGVWH